MLHRLQRIGQWFQSTGRFFYQRLPGPIPKISARQTGQGLGPAGEQVATAHLRHLGYQILERGHRQRLGEIDIIALDGPCIVFVEVKSWASDVAGDPSQAVDRRKQEKLTRAALVYLKQRRLLDQPARFDVVSVVWPSASPTPQIRHFKHAFEAVGEMQMYR